MIMPSSGLGSFGYLSQLAGARRAKDCFSLRTQAVLSRPLCFHASVQKLRTITQQYIDF